MIRHSDLGDPRVREVVVIGGGIAGLSAAIYLGRAQRDALVIDADRSMARWEPEVQNYLGFPEGIGGEALLRKGRQQAKRHKVEFAKDTIDGVSKIKNIFVLRGRRKTYRAHRLLLATGIFHLPPKIPGVKECLGHSMFFCKDCDGYRVRKKRIAIVGSNNQAVEYALGMLDYSACVIIATNGARVSWDKRHNGWLEKYEIPVERKAVCRVRHAKRKIRALEFVGGGKTAIDYLFTTRGDIFHTELATKLGAKVDQDGQLRVDHCMRTSVPALYAAGCITPANCQMIIAAGQGAAAAQAINRDFFEESLRTNSLRRYREVQLVQEKAIPETVAKKSGAKKRKR